ncbi:MAG: type II toxin-antitoxin system PemK/MazF family toxin [Methylococcales bacterium]|nr:type II toxin-antitoxin system PemK/MazF family toxin [Methylococcales bacterium]
MVAPQKQRPWVPNRQDIIWMDCNPQVGQEMRDVHPFLVFSPSIFSEIQCRQSICAGRW